MVPKKRVTVLGLIDVRRAEPHWADISGRSRTYWHCSLGEFALGEVRLADGRVTPRLCSALGNTLIHAETWDAEAQRPTEAWLRNESEAIRTGDGRVSRLPYWKAIGHWDGTRLVNEVQARRRIVAPLTRQAILNSPAWRDARAWRDAEAEPIIWHHGSFGLGSGLSHLDAAMNPHWPFTVANVLALVLEHEEADDWDALLAEWDRRLEMHPGGHDWRSDPAMP